MKEILQPEQVKTLREKRDLTLQQLADRTHVSESYLRKVESGKTVLSIKMASKIVYVLGYSLNDLYKLPKITSFK